MATASPTASVEPHLIRDDRVDHEPEVVVEPVALGPRRERLAALPQERLAEPVDLVACVRVTRGDDAPLTRIDPE